MFSLRRKSEFIEDFNTFRDKDMMKRTVEELGFLFSMLDLYECFTGSKNGGVGSYVTRFRGQDGRDSNQKQKLYDRGTGNDQKISSFGVGCSLFM